MRSSATHQSVAKLLLLVFLQQLYKVSNAAIRMMFKILKLFLYSIGTLTKSPGIIAISDGIPLSLDKCCQLLDIKKSTFTEYIVCPKCNSIYDYRSHELREGLLCKHIVRCNSKKSFDKVL